MSQSSYSVTPQSGFHVALIMDGNGRWAARSGLPRAMGHKAGADALRRVVEAAPGCGITDLSAYAFSSDNWTRPQEEVAVLMSLLSWHLDAECDNLVANDVRTTIIGRRDRLPRRLVAAIERTEKATAHCTLLHFRLAIDYSSRDAIQRSAIGPPVDLLIRTGGEQRLSDFLLWESAYAELLFLRTLWPDFGAAGLHNAVAEFQRRDRRFGGLPVPPPPAAAVERWLR
jgi:undecaprenyl diphosphate synthase